MKLDLVTIGKWALILGLLLSVSAIFISVPALSTILYVLGLVVGFLHITQKESTPFLVALIALILIGITTIQLSVFTDVVILALNNVVAFLSAAGIVVALKQLLGIVQE